MPKAARTAMLPYDPDKRLKLLGTGFHALGLAITLVLAGLGYALAIHPVWEDVRLKRDRAADLQSLLENAAQMRAQHAAMQSTLAAIERESEQLRQRIPPEPAEAEFLSQLSRAAAVAGLVIRDYRPGVVRQATDHWRLEVQLACTGSYQALCAFLDRVASLPRLARISHLEIGGARQPAGYPITLSMTVFFKLEPKGPQAKPGASPPPPTEPGGSAPRRSAAAGHRFGIFAAWDHKPPMKAACRHDVRQRA